MTQEVFFLTGRGLFRCIKLKFLSRTQLKKLGLPHDHLQALDEMRELGRVLNPSIYAMVIGRDSDRGYYFEYLPPIFHAFDYGFYHLVRFLLDEGASLDKRVSLSSTLLDRVLSPLCIRQETIRFLFARDGDYITLDGTSRSICPKALPKQLFTEGNGHQIFALVRGALTASEKKHKFLSLLRWGRRLKSRPEISQGIGLLIMASINESQDILWPSFRVSYIQRMFYSADLHTNRIWKPTHETLSYLGRSGVLTDIWKEMENLFPLATYQSAWYRRGLLPHRLPSLLILAAAFDSTIPTRQLHSVPVAFPGTARYMSFDPWSELDFWTGEGERQREEILGCAVQHVRNHPASYSPSLFEILLGNDFDFLAAGSAQADELFEMGYRHSVFYFFEVCLLVPPALICLGAYFYFQVIVHLLPFVFWLNAHLPWGLEAFFILPVWSYMMLRLIGELVEWVTCVVYRCKRSNFFLLVLLGQAPYTGFSGAQVCVAIGSAGKSINIALLSCLRAVRNLSWRNCGNSSRVLRCISST
jgi:hypothetical protein